MEHFHLISESIPLTYLKKSNIWPPVWAELIWAPLKSQMCLENLKGNSNDFTREIEFSRHDVFSSASNCSTVLEYRYKVLVGISVHLDSVLSYMLWFKWGLHGLEKWLIVIIFIDIDCICNMICII